MKTEEVKFHRFVVLLLTTLISIYAFGAAFAKAYNGDMLWLLVYSAVTISFFIVTIVLFRRNNLVYLKKQQDAGHKPGEYPLLVRIVFVFLVLAHLCFVISGVSSIVGSAPVSSNQLFNVGVSIGFIVYIAVLFLYERRLSKMIKKKSETK